jgi:hypothetical protein
MVAALAIPDLRPLPWRKRSLVTARDSRSFDRENALHAVAPLSRTKPLMSFRLDPQQFEKQEASFFVDTQMMLRLRPGAKDFALIDVRGKKREEVTLRVGDSAPGIAVSEPSFRSDVGWGAQYSATVTIDHGVPAGRYFIPILAIVGSDTATTALVVDVIPVIAAPISTPRVDRELSGPLRRIIGFKDAETRGFVRRFA